MRQSFMRGLAFAGGTAVLAFAVCQNVDHVGGWASARAGLPITVGVIVWLCNLILGEVLQAKRWTFVVLIGGVLLLAETVNQIATTERLAELRLDATAPFRVAAVNRAAAEMRLQAAEKALAEMPTSSARLEAAIADKARVDTDLADKSALRNCAENCRLLLEHAVTDAAHELAAARAALEAERERRRDDVRASRLALQTLPVLREPALEKPLLLGLTFGQWVAALTSLLLNASVTALLAFALHPWTATGTTSAVGPQSCDPISEGMRTEVTSRDVACVDKRPRPRASAEVHALRFAHNCLRHRPGARVSFPALHGAYRAWCRSVDEVPFGVVEILPALQAVLLPLGVRGVMIDAMPYACDVGVVGLPERDAA